MQDKGTAGQDQHLHQDTSSRRGARLRRHWAQGGCRQSQAWDSVGGRAFQLNQGVAQAFAVGRFDRQGNTAGAAGEHPRTNHNPRAGSLSCWWVSVIWIFRHPIVYLALSFLSCSGTRGWTEGRNDQAHPAADSDVHRDTIAWQGTGVRGHGHARQCAVGPPSNRSSHRSPYWKLPGRRRHVGRHELVGLAGLPVVSASLIALQERFKLVAGTFGAEGSGRAVRTGRANDVLDRQLHLLIQLVDVVQVCVDDDSSRVDRLVEDDGQREFDWLRRRHQRLAYQHLVAS